MSRNSASLPMGELNLLKLTGVRARHHSLPAAFSTGDATSTAATPLGASTFSHSLATSRYFH